MQCKACVTIIKMCKLYMIKLKTVIHHLTAAINYTCVRREISLGK